MAASINRGSMIFVQKALKYFPLRQISILTSEKTSLCGSRHRVHHRNVFWHSSSASAAMKDQPAGAEKPSEGEENVKPEASPRETELLQENEKLAENFATMNDKYKRSLADNENIRTRMRKEIADAKQYGIQGFVKDLVEVADVLGRATDSVPKSALDEGNPHLKSLFEGLLMTNAQLLSVFKRHGVAQINPIGEKFNPNLHEALFEQVDDSKEAGTVGTVTQVGYSLHDRVVRPAKVGVVKAKS
ncbi:hypothetical protein JTE90_007982 [Oedothorax gibbosus]|uniref:GrpE protein homolog n=1 Tax=Oedothorax gibbosus TaxID=931172 RepID=A0AAV6UVR2_9ARAC|nr:hypothetical protein JTE90_007982 [Oedothorax gibbosus]